MVIVPDTTSNGNAQSPRPSLFEEKSSPPRVHAVQDGPDCAFGALPSSPGVGRIKAPPMCDIPSLKKEAMSGEELAKFCFPLGEGCDCTEPTAASSSASSISSRESTDHQSSAQLNAKVIARKTSRQGRETQRWITDPQTHQPIRLVTGCVPILKNGQILFVSASRKAEWILPKGGWELDETMEESAVRESFEEAGVLGTLGPKLDEIQYETRKSRKRRLELEEMLKKKKLSPESGFSSGASEDEHQVGSSEKPKVTLTKTPGTEVEATAVAAVPEPLKAPPHATMSADVVDRIRAARASAVKGCDETSSIASDTSGNYSLVRMTLFPLYVCEVKEDWPESGRFRKAMDIDDAIEMMKSRPEFHKALVAVKEKGLHLVQPGAKGIQ